MTMSLARVGTDEYQYRFQLQYNGVTYTHTASADPLAAGHSRTVLFRFNSHAFEIFVEEVNGSTGFRLDKTGDSSSFTSQVNSLKVETTPEPRSQDVQYRAKESS